MRYNKIVIGFNYKINIDRNKELKLYEVERIGKNRKWN